MQRVGPFRQLEAKALFEFEALDESKRPVVEDVRRPYCCRMEESGEASAEASADRGSPSTGHRFRPQQQQKQAHNIGSKDFRSLADERASKLTL